MKTLKESPILDGTLMSEELTSIGNQIAVYFEYAGKIAKVKSEQQTLVKTEKPAGLEIFLKAVEMEEAKRDGKKLSIRERQKLEKSTRYALAPAKIGNSTEMFKIVIHEITTENKHWNGLIALARKEIERMSTQAGAMEKLSKYDPTEGL